MLPGNAGASKCVHQRDAARCSSGAACKASRGRRTRPAAPRNARQAVRSNEEATASCSAGLRATSTPSVRRADLHVGPTLDGLRRGADVRPPAGWPADAPPPARRGRRVRAAAGRRRRRPALRRGGGLADGAEIEALQVAAGLGEGRRPSCHLRGARAVARRGSPVHPSAGGRRSVIDGRRAVAVLGSWSSSIGRPSVVITPSVVGRSVVSWVVVGRRPIVVGRPSLVVGRRQA